MGGDQADPGHSQGMAEPLWCGWLGLEGPGLALLPLSRAQIGMGHGPARHTLAPNIGEDVAGRMWSAGYYAWLSGRNEMTVWLNLWGDSVAWGAWPVGEVGMRRGSSSAAGQAVINMGFLGVDKGRPCSGLSASSSQAPGIWGPQQSVLALSPSQCVGNPVVALDPAWVSVTVEPARCPWLPGRAPNPGLGSRPCSLPAPGLLGLVE